MHAAGAQRHRAGKQRERRPRQDRRREHTSAPVKPPASSAAAAYVPAPTSAACPRLTNPAPPTSKDRLSAAIPRIIARDNRVSTNGEPRPLNGSRGQQQQHDTWQQQAPHACRTGNSPTGRKNRIAAIAI